MIIWDAETITESGGYSAQLGHLFVVGQLF
jgi:hypothetical protein